MLLRDKNAVIYGAGGSIGGAVARTFAKEGCKVHLAGRTLAKVQAVANEIVAAGGRAEAAEVDTPFHDFFKPIQKAARTQFLTARAVGRRMTERGQGVMLTVTAGPPEAIPAIGGFGPACQMIEGLWRGLAAELGPRGVRVVCLRSAGSPDSTDFQEMVRQHAAAGADREAFLATLGSDALLRRLPSLTEVASVAAMMASDGASAVTGTFIHVTCGSRAG